MATTQESKDGKLDALKQKFQGKLDDTRKKLDEMKHKVASAREQDRQELGKQRDEIHQRVEEQGKRMQELRDNLKDWQKEASTHTKDAVTSWRQKLEIDKLRRRADRAEDSAVDALYIAMLDVDAAEEAVLDAISARIDFETTSPSP
jgi:uncharacterized coiled-coil DUF342 family protein